MLLPANKPSLKGAKLQKRKILLFLRSKSLCRSFFFTGKRKSSIMLIAHRHRVLHCRESLNITKRPMIVTSGVVFFSFILPLGRGSA